MAQWTTRDFGAPAVRWGAQPGTAQHQNNGSYSTYTKLQMCGAPANAKGAVPHHSTSPLGLLAESRLTARKACRACEIALQMHSPVSYESGFQMMNQLERRVAEASVRSLPGVCRGCRVG